MKKIVLFAAMMLLGAIQNVIAQVDYSLEGISKTLSKLHFTSSGVCLGDFHEGLAWVRVSKGENNKLGGDDWYGYIDTKGNMVTPCIYTTAKDFSEGLARVRSNDWNYGFIDKQGNVVIPFTLGEHVGDFSEGLACVLQKEHVGYINKKGELVIPYIDEDSEGGAFSGGIAPIQIGSYETYFIDINGKTVIPSKPFRCVGYKDGLFTIKYKGGYFGLMDAKGDMITKEQYIGIGGTSEGLCIVVMRKNTIKSGYIDVKNGNEVIPPQFDGVRPFSEGLAAVQIEGKWGYINKQGELVIPCKYKEAYDFHVKLAFVKTEDGYIIIDKQGNTIQHLPNYEYFGKTFSDGLAVIKQNGKWGYVDVYGNSTINPK